MHYSSQSIPNSRKVEADGKYAEQRTMSRLRKQVTEVDPTRHSRTAANEGRGSWYESKMTGLLSPAYSRHNEGE